MAVASLSLTSKKRLPTYVYLTCEVEIIGVGSSMFNCGEGTAYVLLTASMGSEYVGVIHNCLQGTGLHDLLSLSQLQILPKKICSLANSDPYLTVNNIRLAVNLINGVYELPYTILTRDDSRRYRLSHLVLTPGGAFTPVSSATWTKRVISTP